jgi:hypothetical protein
MAKIENKFRVCIIMFKEDALEAQLILACSKLAVGTSMPLALILVRILETNITRKPRVARDIERCLCELMPPPSLALRISDDHNNRNKPFPVANSE